jgi:hypothetical protein
MVYKKPGFGGIVGMTQVQVLIPRNPSLSSDATRSKRLMVVLVLAHIGRKLAFGFSALHFLPLALSTFLLLLLVHARFVVHARGNEGVILW